MELFWNWIRQLLCAYCGFWLFLSVLPEHSARNYVRLFGSLILLLLFLEPVLESFGDGEAFGKLVGGFTFRQEAADLTNTMEAAAELGNEAVRNGFEKEAARQAEELAKSCGLANVKAQVRIGEKKDGSLEVCAVQMTGEGSKEEGEAAARMLCQAYQVKRSSVRMDIRKEADP